MNFQPFPIITFGQHAVIKYWDEIETEIKEPPEEKEGMFLNKLNEVLTQKEATQFVKALRNEEVQFNISSCNERGALERNAYLEKGFVYHRITFDENEVNLKAFEDNINP